MRALLVAILLSLAACTPTKVGTVPVSERLSPAEQQAQSAIHEANILLNAAARVIGQNVQDKIMTKAEGQKALDQVRSYATDVDRAQRLLDSGDVLNAQNQAELAKKLIVILHREIAEKARQ